MLERTPIPRRWANNRATPAAWAQEPGTGLRRRRLATGCVIPSGHAEMIKFLGEQVHGDMSSGGSERDLSGV